MPKLPFAINTVAQDTYRDLKFEVFWDFEENPGTIRDRLLGKEVSKVGVRHMGQLLRLMRGGFLFMVSMAFLSIVVTLGA
jgi:hypothetical protein